MSLTDATADPAGNPARRSPGDDEEMATVSLSIPRDLYNHVREVCERRGLELAVVVVDLLDRFLPRRS